MNEKEKAQKDLYAIHEMFEAWEWPNNTGSIIQTVLEDPAADPAIRLLAVGMAGDSVIMNNEIGRIVIALVCNNDEPEDLRAKAAIAFGVAFEYADLMEFDDPDDLILSEDVFHEIAALLKMSFHDVEVPKLVRRRILEASIRAPQDWHSEAVRAAYLNDDQEWRVTALFCMGYLPGFEQQVLEALDSDDKDLRFEALGAAGNRGMKKAWPLVSRLLSDPGTDRITLFTAIEATANMNLREASEPLERLLLSDDEDIAEAAMESLAMLGIGRFADNDEW